MKILITGASGFIGSRLATYLGKKHVVFGTYYQNQRVSIRNCSWFQLDVRDDSAVFSLIVDKLKPEIIIHIAGTKDIEFCQKKYNEAYYLNTRGTQYVCSAAEKIDAKVVYLSSDCVFDGKKHYYTEDDVTSPYNNYGKTKWLGEKIVERNPNNIIIRVSLLYGWIIPGQSTNHALQVLNNLVNEVSVYSATNLYNTPLSIEQAIYPISSLALYNYKGLYHLGGSTRISRYHFSIKIADTFGLDKKLIFPYEDTSGIRQENSCLSSKRDWHYYKHMNLSLKNGLEFMRSNKFPSGLKEIKEGDRL